MGALNQNQDPEMAEELKKKVDILKINVNARDLLDGDGANIVYHPGVPPYNINATTPQQAYPLDKIVLQGEWNCLLDILELVEAGSALDRSAYPTFVFNRVERLRNIQDEEERTKLARIFSYITHLIKFKDQHSAEASSAMNHHIPNIIRQKFTTMFSTPEMRTLTKENISLLVNYVLVLTLFADDFRTDLLDIASDLRMSIVVLKNNVQHLGGKVDKVGKTFYATLSVPLKFPPHHHRNEKRRK